MVSNWVAWALLVTGGVTGFLVARRGGVRGGAPRLTLEAVFNTDNEAALHKRNAIYAQVFNLVPDTLTLTRIADGKFVQVNQNWEALTGFTREETIGHTSAELGLWVEPTQRARLIETFKRDGAVRDFDVTFRHKQGHLYYLKVAVSLFQFDGETYMLGAFQDVTAKRAVDLALQELNLQLEERVHQRTQSLEKSNSELAAALDTLRMAKDDLVRSEKMAALGSLVAGVAHEINTPIGICVTATSHVKEQVEGLAHRLRGGSLSRRQMDDFLLAAAEATSLIESHLRRASELIRSFKLVAVDQTGEQDREFDLGDYLQEVMRSLRPQLSRSPAQVAISCPPGIRLYGNPGNFSQIITNFVMNSLLHAFEGRASGQIRIDVSASPDDVILVYADDGLGIASEHLPHIFDPFFTTRRGSGGSGLGLPIVYNLVTQSLGGSIRCISSPGEGASFEIRFPCRRQP